MRSGARAAGGTGAVGKGPGARGSLEGDRGPPPFVFVVVRAALCVLRARACCSCARALSGRTSVSGVHTEV